MKKMSIFAMLLAAVVVTSYSVSGTYAKYTSNATGTDSARVAKWSFTVGTTELATSNEFEFDLFATTYDNVAAADNGDGTFDKVIAPGTAGEFAIELANESEVNATYEIDYTVDNDDDIPVEFSIDDGNTWTTTLADVDATAINANGSEATIKVQWRWAFEGTGSENFKTAQTDETDTEFGTAAASTITVSAKVTATQVD